LTAEQFWDTLVLTEVSMEIRKIQDWRRLQELRQERKNDIRTEVITPNSCCTLSLLFLSMVAVILPPTQTNTGKDLSY
jgi:hypothetical protein